MSDNVQFCNFVRKTVLANLESLTLISGKTGWVQQCCSNGIKQFVQVFRLAYVWWHNVNQSAKWTNPYAHLNKQSLNILHVDRMMGFNNSYSCLLYTSPSPRD